MSRAEELKQEWQARLAADHPNQPAATQDSVVGWLLGSDLARYEDLPPSQWGVIQQALEYRYRILQQRYLGVGPDAAYRNLLQRLASLSLIRSKVQTWVSLSRDRQRSVMDVLKEVVQELIQGDNYIRQQVEWIAQCTPNPRLRNSLLLASIEEYCLRPIRNQPLLVYRFVNYLRRSQRGGMTQVPTGDIIRFVSDEIGNDEAETSLSLTDVQALEQYQEQQVWEEQQTLRKSVMDEFMHYLEEKVDPLAAQWLELHVQGRTQEAIAAHLNVPIKQVYRLREKISYHAKNVFGSKLHPDLVGSWLGTTLEHNFGIPIQTWPDFLETLLPNQQQLIQDMKQHQTLEAVAQMRNGKLNQLKSEWTKILLEAYAFRSAAPDASDINDAPNDASE